MIRRMSKRLAALAAVAASMSGGGSWASAAMVAASQMNTMLRITTSASRPPRAATASGTRPAPPRSCGRLDVASRQPPHEPAELLGVLRLGGQRDADRHDGIGDEGGDGAPEAGGELGAEIDPPER